MTEILNISEAEYRALPYASYSALKRLDDSGPRSIQRQYKFDSDAIDFGSLLDCKLLTPELFNDKFYIDATEKPTAQLLDLANHILENYPDGNPSKEDILQMSYDLKIFGNSGDEARLSKFDKDLFWNYVSAKRDSVGKIVFTPDILAECVEAEQIMRTHSKVKHLFTPSEYVEVLTQIPILTEVNGVKVKVLIDLIVIDHLNKTITPYDLKSTEYRQINFPIQFKRMKYYIQGALYKTALTNVCSDVWKLGYALQDFRFVVYSRSDKYPFIWNMGYDWHLMGMDGFVGDNGEYMRGVNKLLEEYNFYLTNGVFDIEKCFIENDIIEL